jgi:DnaJ family protein B protein 12
MRFDGPVTPHTLHRLTTRHKVDYYLNPVEVEHFTPHKFSQLDKMADTKFIQQLQYNCERELDLQQRMVEEARGWFVHNTEKMNQARNLEMKNCRKLDSMGLARGGY